MATNQSSSATRLRLSEGRFNSLLKLVREYERTSQVCADGRKYYGACILLGAALEGYMVALCSLYPKEALAAIGRLPPNKRPSGSLLRWDLSSLAAVAIETGWLPARKDVRSPRKVGDFVDLLREVRNFVHLGKHIREYPKVRIGAKHYSDARAVFEAATSWLSHRVEQDLWKQLEREKRMAARRGR